MDNKDFPSIDSLPLSHSDSDLIEKLTESNSDPEDRAAFRASLTLLLRQRNMLAYQLSELLNPAATVQSELVWKATHLQTQLH